MCIGDIRAEVEAPWTNAANSFDRFRPRPQPRRVNVRIACELNICCLECWLDDLERNLRCTERCVECSLISMIESGEIYGG